MLDPVKLNLHADRIRADVLGRSKAMRRLFDFLVSCSAAGKAPKEIEVAIDVFDKDVSFEPGRDALVRVYIHKLRRKLEVYYSGPARREEHRLVIPKGEYRLVFEAATVPKHVQREIPAVLSMRWKAGVLALLLTLANVGIWLMTRPESAPASPVLAAQRSTHVVVGDCYLLGETDERLPISAGLNEVVR